ncbi:hypothetical protein HA72_0824 [Metallosphaera sedula]|uniref:Uncharacterized protein n=3 Tax=Metallosphaera TaxID=41980 RepID=A4YEZ7_METS5|nr:MULTISPECIES: hypothetical protein [Metallosphaera]ABP94999.1 hypothetical protein Msed_0824 [Metallosphaera sedula DSM 5348]AIM26985.1 hypothetical protein HA72_0824 [Metallosphaera sedula]AKV73908.1 hypothetical protein MsedA_0839 [Metallosphaera sedula]AKV76149.1 hypothetical protein MsedB_0840 [Metallosphaera sedula]AKV78401.1 hypothetical protein MsedC_0839 [Metallosphaera sedula]
MRFEDKMLRWRKFADICAKFSSDTFYDYPLLNALQVGDIETELEEIVSQFFVDRLEMTGKPYRAKRGTFYFDDERTTEGYENDDMVFQVVYRDRSEYLEEKDEIVKGLQQDPEETEEAEVYAFITSLMEFTLSSFLRIRSKGGEPDCISRKRCFLSLKFGQKG